MHPTQHRNSKAGVLVMSIDEFPVNPYYSPVIDIFIDKPSKIISGHVIFSINIHTQI